MPAKLWKSKKYPNLFKDEASGTWLFRKYSSTRRKEFFRSTGEKSNEARAYKLGLDAFNEWLGKVADEGGVVYFERYGRRYLNRKLENPKLAQRTRRNFQDMFEASDRPGRRKGEPPRPRLFDAFGHLPIDKINNEVWMTYVAEILKLKGEFKFFNTRKALLEVLRDAHANGYLDRVPKLDLPDEDAAPPRALTREELRRLFRAAHYVERVGGRGRAPGPKLRPDGKGVVRHKNWIKLLMFILWRQGARPGEILQYEWSMIRWDEGPFVREIPAGETPRFDEPRVGRIHIPGRITKTRRSRVINLNASVSRVLRFLQARATSPCLFPSPHDPSRPLAGYKNAWEGVCERAEMAAQMYWFRDTWVTRKLAEGQPTIFVAKYIDSSAEMLERKYAVATDQVMERVAG